MTGSIHQKPTWQQESAHHFIAVAGERRVDVQYEPAGFQSGWAVYTDNRLISRCAEFMQAKGVALQAALAPQGWLQATH